MGDHYPVVRVENAPGFADFTGVLLMETMSADNRPMSVIGYEWNGRRDFDVFDSRYVVVAQESKCPYTHSHTRYWCGYDTCREG